MDNKFIEKVRGLREAQLAACVGDDPMGCEVPSQIKDGGSREMFGVAPGCEACRRVMDAIARILTAAPDVVGGMERPMQDQLVHVLNLIQSGVRRREGASR
jgi:hypothetical protein